MNATVSQNVIDAMKEARIHELLLPKSYGGPQIDLKTYAKLIREISVITFPLAGYPFYTQFIIFGSPICRKST